MTTTTLMTDLSFDEYTRRQYRELAPDKLLERAMAVRPSGNYRYNGAGWEPLPYPGFAVISMADENPGNESLVTVLRAMAAGLIERCPWEGSIYLLPADSYHQTVANTLSEKRFLDHVVGAGLEGEYPGMVERAFEKVGRAPKSEGRQRSDGEPGAKGAQPLAMKMIGLSIFGTALGVLGVFENEADYQRILHFRSGFYSDRGLAALDVRMTRPFIGHITLAYIETDLTGEQRQQLAAAVHALNGQLKGVEPIFNISSTGLRRYDNLSVFRRKDGFPLYHF
jgi:hypothetical protein